MSGAVSLVVGLPVVGVLVAVAGAAALGCWHYLQQPQHVHISGIYSDIRAHKPLSRSMNRHRYR